MKITTHPRMENILVGDEVYSNQTHLYARVEETFPAAVCVKIGMLELSDAYNRRLHLTHLPQLWRADDIENLSVCRCCGTRHDLHNEHDSGVPYRICASCRSAVSPLSDQGASHTQRAP